METQLSDHQRLILEAVYHAIFISDSARPES